MKREQKQTSLYLCMKLLPLSWFLYAVPVSQKGQNKARKGTEKTSMNDQRYGRGLIQGHA